MSAQNRHEGNIQKCQVEINGYKRQGSNKVQLFGGNNVPVLLQAIERAKKSFKTMPLGPLGQVRPLITFFCFLYFGRNTRMHVRLMW